MNLSGTLLNTAEKFRPVLLKIVPIGLLRKVKDILTERNIKKVMKQNKKLQASYSYHPELFEDGINLIGPIRAEIGLGQSCRLVADELAHTKVGFSIQDFILDGALRAEDHSFDEYVQDDLPYGINLFHIEPLDLSVAFANTLDLEVWKNRYNIAFWLWELEEFPKRWRMALDLVDEVWTPSEFASESVRKVTDKPVYTIPYHVTAPVDDKFDRKHFDLPEDKFLFLVMYDTNSTMARKNPMGAVEAFKKAFTPENTQAGLVLKMNNPREEDLAKIKEELREYPNVYFVTKILTKVEVNSLIKAVDVFVSLHRAEGFGLVMAEAMLNGTPCIATDWSSNTEFMSKDVACMVDYTFTTLEKPAPPYEKGARWADANVDTAAEYMKRLSTDEAYYKELSKNAKAYAEEKLGMEQAVAKIEERLREIKETAGAKA